METLAIILVFIFTALMFAGTISTAKQRQEEKDNENQD